MEKENEVLELSKIVEEREITDNFIGDVVEIFQADGKFINSENGREQLLGLVKDLVKNNDSVSVEKGDIATSDDELKKLGDENEMLSRECKILNETLKKSEDKFM